MTRLVPEPHKARRRRLMPLDAVIEGARPVLTRAAGGPGALVLDLRSTAVLHAERAVIERVLEELVACACRCTPDGCRITIRTRDPRSPSLGRGFRSPPRSRCQATAGSDPLTSLKLTPSRDG